jgi:hypothetical protein
VYFKSRVVYDIVKYNTTGKMKTQPKYVTVAQLSKLHPAFSEASLRWIIHKKDENGFKSCTRRVGAKLLISLSEFEKWIENMPSE